MKHPRIPRREIFVAAAALAVLAACAAQLSAQQAEVPRRTEVYIWSTGEHDGAGARSLEKASRLAFQDVVSVPGVPWIQLRFAAARLGPGSYLEITSLADGARQQLDARSLEEWGNRSAYFNGDSVDVQLWVAPRDRGAVVEIEEVVVGEWVFGTKDICGTTDDRVASSEPRGGRIDPIGCTGWIASNGKLLTAGHCLAAAGNQTLSFNPPPSLPDGTVQFPSPQNQYAIDQQCFQFSNRGIGDDWGLFQVFNNSQTGLKPVQAQGGFTLQRNLGPANIRITGFGLDTGTTNQTNQTHVGPNAGSSGTTMRYRADTRGGNSGSPIINTANGQAVGVHTHGGCTATGGNNNGTSFFREALWRSVSGTGFSFFEGNDGTQDLVCIISAARQQVNFQSNSLSCENDEARSVILSDIPAKANVRIYDSPSCSTSDDWTEIKTTSFIPSLTIASFETSFSRCGVSVTHHHNNGLDGKVSCVKIAVCGDGVCDPGPESCSTCSADCGTCAPPPSCQPTGASCSIFDPPDHCCSGTCVLPSPSAFVGTCGL